MYRTNGTIITDAGIQLWNDALANSKSITFTTIKLGTGDVNSEEEARALLDLVSFYGDIGISNREETSEGYLKLRSYYTNDNLTESVTIKETGVYARIDDGTETLFAYINDGEGETIPPKNGLNAIQRTRDIVIGITQQIPLNVIIDDSMFATIYDLEQKADKAIQMIAGNGLSGGGDLSADRTLNVVSANDGIIVNADNIELKSATPTVIGGVKPGFDMTVDSDGTMGYFNNNVVRSKNVYTFTTGILIDTTVPINTTPRICATLKGYTFDSVIDLMIKINTDANNELYPYLAIGQCGGLKTGDIKLIEDNGYVKIWLSDTKEFSATHMSVEIQNKTSLTGIPTVVDSILPPTATQIVDVPLIDLVTANETTIPVGGILVMADATSPVDKYPGTTWAIQADGRYMMGGNQSTVNEALGSNSITIAHGNLPAVNLTATDHTHTRGSMEITGGLSVNSGQGILESTANTETGSGAFRCMTSSSSNGSKYEEAGFRRAHNLNFTASRSWTGATSGASALTVPLGGSGTALSITPAYTKFVYWKRTA